MALRIGVFIAAALLLAAHFLRQGNIVAVVFCAAAPLLFLWRRRWSLITLQLLAYAATATWIVTLLHIIEQRQLAGRAWTTAALILGVVALLTLLAGLLLNSRSFRERYPPDALSRAVLAPLCRKRRHRPALVDEVGDAEDGVTQEHARTRPARDRAPRI